MSKSAEYQREWRRNNPEKVKERNARSWAKNKEKMAAANKAWRAANPEKLAVYRARAAARRPPDQQHGYWVKHYETPHGRAVALVTSAKARSKAAGIDFSITVEWVEAKIAAGVCEVTGMPLELARHKEYTRHPFAPSLDRENPKLGYTKDNVRIVACIYNLAKGEFSPEHVEVLARAVLGISKGAS